MWRDPCLHNAGVSLRKKMKLTFRNGGDAGPVPGRGGSAQLLQLQQGTRTCVPVSSELCQGGPARHPFPPPPVSQGHLSPDPQAPLIIHSLSHLSSPRRTGVPCKSPRQAGPGSGLVSGSQQLDVLFAGGQAPRSAPSWGHGLGGPVSQVDGPSLFLRVLGGEGIGGHHPQASLGPRSSVWLLHG